MFIPLIFSTDVMAPHDSAKDPVVNIDEVKPAFLMIIESILCMASPLSADVRYSWTSAFLICF